MTHENFVAVVEAVLYLGLTVIAVENLLFWVRVQQSVHEDGKLLVPLLFASFCMLVGSFALFLRAFVIAVPYHDGTHAAEITDFVIRPFHAVILFSTFAALRIWRQRL